MKILNTVKLTNSLIVILCMAYNYYTNFYFAGKKFVRFKSAPDDLHFISFLRSLIKYKIIYPNQRSGIKRFG